MKKDILKVLLSNILTALVGLITGVVFPKIMNVEEYAEYQTFNLYLSYIALAQIGLATGMVINYAGHNYVDINKKQYKSEIELLFIILAFFSVFIGFNGIILKQKIIILNAVVLIPYIIVESYKSFYQAWADFTKFSLLNAAIPLVRIILAFAYFGSVGNLSGLALIVITIFIYFSFFLSIFAHMIKDLFNVNSAKIFSRNNFNTIKLGFSMLIGNYLDTVFKSIDKLFVNIYYSTFEFAYFSFALSIQNYMKIVVTSIAQPMLPLIASGKIERHIYNRYKQMLIIFGAFSCISYYLIDFLIKQFLDKYISSLPVIYVYFIAFPAISVINCLLLNLYKAKKETKSYIISLIVFLSLAIVFDIFVVLFKISMIYIAIVTVIVYYIWFFYGCHHFDELSVKLQDVLFLFAYIALYIICAGLFDLFLSIVTYFVGLVALTILLYRSSFIYICNQFVTSIKNIIN